MPTNSAPCNDPRPHGLPTALHLAVIEWPDGPGPAPVPTVFASPDDERVHVLALRELSSLRPESLDNTRFLAAHPTPAEDDAEDVAAWLDDFAVFNSAPRLTFYAAGIGSEELVPVD